MTLPAQPASFETVPASPAEAGDEPRSGSVQTLPQLPSVAAHTRRAWAMPERLIQQFMTDAPVRWYPAGAMIVHEGDPAGWLYLVQSGTVRGFVTDDGGRQLVLGELGPGEYFGETLIDGGERCLSGMAVTDARVASIPRSAFLSALASDSEFMLHLMRKFSLRVRAASEFVRRLALADARERVLLFLREMALARGDVQSPLLISQQSIGNRVGATRSMVNRVLKRLADEDIVVVSPAGISLRRLPARLPGDTTRHGRTARGGAGSAAPHERVEVSATTLVCAPQRLTRPLPTDLIEVVRARGRAMHYMPGTVVTREGDPADSFCLIVRGRLLGSLTNGAGRVFHLGVLADGEYFGENMVVPDGVWVTRFTVIERCEIVHVAPEDFFELLHERPDFARHLLVKLSQRLRTLTHQARRLALQDVVERTRTLLLELCTGTGHGPRMLPAGLSQQAISERVGASRSMVNRVMRELHAEGFVQTIDGRLALPANGPHAARA